MHFSIRLLINFLHKGSLHNHNNYSNTVYNLQFCTRVIYVKIYHWKCWLICFNENTKSARKSAREVVTREVGREENVQYTYKPAKVLKQHVQQLFCIIKAPHWLTSRPVKYKKTSNHYFFIRLWMRRDNTTAVVKTFHV